MSLHDDVIDVIRKEIGVREVEWRDPTPATKGNAAGESRPPRLTTIYPMLKLVPGHWLRVGPLAAGSYHATARAAGLEVTSRHEDGMVFLYLRAPEVKP